MVRWRFDWPKYLALSIGVIVSAFGAAVLIAWYVHFVPVIKLSPTLPPLTRQGALALFLLGAALACLAGGRKRAAAVCATIPLVLAVLVCFEYILDRNLGIDQLLGSAYITEGASPPGRISPVAALSYLGSSLALLAMSSRRLARHASTIAGIAASMLIAVGSVMFLAYLLGHTLTYGWGHYRRISLQADAALVLLGVGIMALAMRESRIRKTLPEWLPLSLGLGLAAGALGIWQALIAHEERDLPLLSGIILAGGLLGAWLVAITVYLAQKATLRSRELQEGKTALERLFEASPDALLVTDRQGCIIGANQRVESVFGYPREELLGQPIESFVPVKLRDLHKVHREGYYSSPSARPMGQGLELRARRRDGREFPVDISLSPLQSGGEMLVLTTVRDVSERKQAEEALRQSEERFRGVFERSPLGLALIQQDYRLAKVNPSLCRMSGYSEAELTGMNPIDLTHPDDRQTSIELAERLFKGEIPFYHVEKRYVKKSGEIIWVNMTATILRDREGRPMFGLGMVQDITERKQEQEELRTLTQRLSLATRSASMGVWDWNLRTDQAIWDDTMFQIFGIPKQASVAREEWARRIHPDDLAKIGLFLKTVVCGKTLASLEFRLIRPDGSLRHVSATGGAVLDGRGHVTGVVGIAVDVTQRKRAEEELHALSARLSQATRFASMGVWEWDPATNSFVFDDTAFAMLGIPRVAPLDHEEFARWVDPDDLPKVEAALKRIVREKRQESVEFRVIRPDGALRHVYAAGGAVLDKDQQGTVVRVVGIAFDITERKRAQEELWTLSERQSLATRIASIGVWDWDLRTNLEVWDDAAFEMFGLAKVNPLRHEDVIRCFHPDDLSKVEAITKRMIHEKTQVSEEFRIIRTDGSLRHLSVAAGPVADEQGTVIRVVGIAIDITERKQMEAKLEASREQMVASARLSALGMMAGGIAHEINNPLSIIHALASDLREMVEEEGSAPPQVVARKSAIIRETAERIAKIVKSLLQISREGTSDALHPARLAKILEETLEICQARFKANGVKLLLPQEIPDLNVFCREVQIEQALLNLLQNAFDAVVDQEGDRWVRLEVGRGDDSVIISVLDNGPGILPEQRSRIMEPFFTTKEVGKGTGLGLSLSKTIAEEHGGKLEYIQERGHTRFSLVLPLARKAEAA